MNQQRLFRRKIAYFASIAVLLFPLFALSQPATTKSQGGRLAQLRKQHQLSQADLGEIDPTSVSMKLATFGLHGTAVNLLWAKANDYKEREDFTNFDATLQQITYLQPHFYKVWDYQGHNVAFNISVEFDDYRDRYQHVIKGFNLLKKGIRYNDKEPRLLRRLAFYTGFKIGRSDERRFYRPMFAADKDYHAPPYDQNELHGTRYEGRPESLSDNWLVSKWWFQQAEDLIDSGVVTYGKMNPFLLHSDPPMQQIQYAEALENDGIFDQSVLDAWEKASVEWLAFGLRPIITTAGFKVKLEDSDRLRKIRDNGIEDLIAMDPDLHDRLRQEHIDDLTPESRAAWEKPAEERSSKESSLAHEAGLKVKVMPAEMASAIGEDKREMALKLVDRFNYYNIRHRMVDSYRRNTINYSYWKHRCETEQTDELISARREIFVAKEAYRASDIPSSIAHFEKGFDLWRLVIDANPSLLEEETLVQDLMEMVEGYGEVLAHVREDGSREMPDDFALPDLLEAWDNFQKKYFKPPGAEST